MKKADFLSSNGHLTEDAVYLYSDALKLERAEELPPEVLDHVADCTDCRREIQNSFDLIHGQDFRTRTVHPYLDQKKIHWMSPASTITRLAAVIVLGLGIALLTYLLIPEMETTTVYDETPEETREIALEKMQPLPPDIVKSEELPPIPTRVPERVDLYAANFEPSPFFESLIHQQFRSHAVRVLTPEIDEKVQNGVRFSWESRLPMVVHLTILTNTEEIVWETTTDQQSITFSDSLVPGIYYWRIETDDELLYIGKFTVPVR